MILPSGGQQVPEKLLGIYINIGPVALRSRGAVCCVRDIFGDHCHVACFEVHLFPENLNVPAVGMAYSDFQTIMKMEPAAGHIRYFPIIAGEQQYRKMHWQVITSIFCYGAFWFCHTFFRSALVRLLWDRRLPPSRFICCFVAVLHWLGRPQFVNCLCCYWRHVMKFVSERFILFLSEIISLNIIYISEIE